MCGRLLELLADTIEATSENSYVTEMEFPVRAA
jgi:hypothetical protein